jgi:phosphoribosyl 1,2-cyclic phosphodiesterase
MDDSAQTTATDVPPSPGNAAFGAVCDEASLCVLASSSSGNCSVLSLGRGEHRRLILIDAGLSPRRTRALLRDLGVADVPLLAVLLTHLDDDHWYTGWSKSFPPHARVFVHRRHGVRAHRMGISADTARVFDQDFDLVPGVRVRPALMSHDDLGSVAYRIDFEDAGRSLGFATDLGRANQRLIDHLTGVDVLAIESNYCPRMQVGSGRPEYLKRRIMDGSGHLSNEQAAEAVKAIGPREHVVLLHLSQECNFPHLASMHHDGCPYQLTIARPDRPTPWIRLTWPQARPAAVVSKGPAAQGTLWA